MEAIVVSRSDKTFKIEVEIPYNTNMLSAEEDVQQRLNKAGILATKELLTQHDTDGSPIIVSNIKLTSRGQESKEFQTPYGAIAVDRHVYQPSTGGMTYAPLDVGAKIIGTSTPKFAKMISSKYACDGAPGVQRDLAENHNRHVALSFIKNTSDTVGAIALAKEEHWNYQLPELPNAVGSISIGLDGTCLNMMDNGWREVMCGTIAFFDREGERVHTIFTAAPPGHAKETFTRKFQNEINKIIKLYPYVPLVGISDGSASNWSFLKKQTEILTIDFWHMAKYLDRAAKVMFLN